MCSFLPETIDVTEILTVDDFKALKARGVKTVLLRCYRSYARGVVDQVGIENAKRAYSVGLGIGFYHFPTMDKGAALQANEAMDAIRRAGLSNVRIYLDIECEAYRNCSEWKFDNKQANIKFAKDFREAVNRSNGDFSMGIYTNKHFWEKIMGDGCRDFGDLPLWWTRFNQSAEFESFGNWVQRDVVHHQYKADQRILLNSKYICIDFNKTFTDAQLRFNNQQSTFPILYNTDVASARIQRSSSTTMPSYRSHSNDGFRPTVDRSCLPGGGFDIGGTFGTRSGSRHGGGIATGGGAYYEYRHRAGGGGRVGWGEHGPGIQVSIPIPCTIM